MTEALPMRTLSITLILLVFSYTVYLVRSNKLSAHLAVSWIVTEIAFFVLCLSDWLLAVIRSILGESSSLLGAMLLGLTWLAFLALDSLTRISSLTVKLKEINQELALLRERAGKIEKQ